MTTQPSLTTVTACRELAEQQAKIKVNPNDRSAELATARLEKAVANAERQDQRIAAMAAEREAQQATRAAQSQADLEHDLRQKYEAAMPMPTNDVQWEVVKDSVLHKHRLSEMDRFDEQIAAARATGKYSI